MVDAFQAHVDAADAGYAGERGDQAADVVDQQAAHVVRGQAALVQQRFKSGPEVTGFDENTNMRKGRRIRPFEPVMQTLGQRALPDHEFRAGDVDAGETVP